MSPQSIVVLHRCIALLRTMPGVTEEKIQAVLVYLGEAIEEAEKEESCQCRPALSQLHFS